MIENNVDNMVRELILELKNNQYWYNSLNHK
jgi:hypothetical protein